MHLGQKDDSNHTVWDDAGKLAFLKNGVEVTLQVFEGREGHMDATAVAVGIGGVAQPYLRALLANRTGFDKEQNAVGTALIALLIALFATWVTGGFASLPPWTPTDPSPLLAYLWPKWTSVYALSHLVFAGTQGTVRKLTCGSIANIAVTSAFLAVRAGTPVTMPLVLRAARAEFHKLERPINDADFRYLEAAGAGME